MFCNAFENMVIHGSIIVATHDDIVACAWQLMAARAARPWAAQPGFSVNMAGWLPGGRLGTALLVDGLAQPPRHSPGTSPAMSGPGQPRAAQLKNSWFY